ncbi:MAG TPA: MFS transporter [Steroidobacteraceae bacterium]|nr:MFS transporter [Steroidobacteraceae bacterium]
MTISHVQTPGYPPRRSALYVGFLVFLATVCSLLDRQILALLVAPIRKDLHISDTQMSLLYGFAFVLLYCTMGLPLGRIVDRWQRKFVLSAGVATWSLMTLLCGLAPDFRMLFIARIGVGIGEACLVPAACSLLADCFAPQTRGRAMGFYTLGIYVGLGLSMIAGGVLYDRLIHSAPLPVFGALPAWREVFVLVSIPGFVVSLLALTLREPARQDTLSPLGSTHEARPSPAFLSYLMEHRKVLGPALLANGLLAFMAFAVLGWAPSVLSRQYSLSGSAIGLTLGALSTGGGAAGALIGAYVCDRWTARGRMAAKYTVTATAALLSGVGLVILALSSTVWMSVTAIGVCIIAPALWATSSQAMVQELYPNRLRGQGSALVVMGNGLFGLGGGPLAVGFLSDHVFIGHPLSTSIVAVALPAVLGTLLLYFLSRRGYEALRQLTLGLKLGGAP